MNITKRRLAWIMPGIMLSLLLAALDETIVGSAMPQIIGDLKGAEHYTWPFTAYLLTATAVIPVSGRISFLYGRKSVQLGGIMIFTLGSMLCGFAPGMGLLTAFRTVQGIGGGVLISSAFIILSEHVEMRNRMKYIGILASMFGVASLAGPALGGIISGFLSWRWVFFINAPMGLAAFAISAAAIPSRTKEKRKEGSDTLDLLGVAAFLLTVCPLILVLSEGGRLFAWASSVSAACLGLSILMGTVFVRRERMSRNPLLLAEVFREPCFRVSGTTAFLAYAGLFGSVFFIPLFAQSVLGMSVAVSGAIMVPMTTAIVIGSNMGGVLSRKFDAYGKIVRAGFLTAFCGALLLAVSAYFRSPSALVFSGVLVGFGVGLTIQIYNVAAQSVLPREKLPLVISAIEFLQNAGGIVSASVCGAVIAGAFGPSGKGIGTSIGIILLLMAAVFFIACVSAYRFDDGRIREGMGRKLVSEDDDAGEYTD